MFFLGFLVLLDHWFTLWVFLLTFILNVVCHFVVSVGKNINVFVRALETGEWMISCWARFRIEYQELYFSFPTMFVYCVYTATALAFPFQNILFYWKILYWFARTTMVSSQNVLVPKRVTERTQHDK